MTVRNVGYLGDTNWVPLVMLTGFTTADVAAVRRIGDVVYWKGKITRTAGVYPTTASTVATLPTLGGLNVFRPVGFSRFSLAGFGSANANGLMLQLDATTNNVIIQGIGVSAADAHLSGVTYLAT